MRNRIWLFILAVVITWLYQRCGLWAIHFAESHTLPPWWEAMFESFATAFFSWMQLLVTAYILMVSLPLAFLIDRLYGRVRMPLAFTISIGLNLLLLPFVIRGISRSAPIQIWSLAFDLVRGIGMLPLLVWAMHKLHSNNRFERSRGRVFAGDKEGVDD